MLLGYFKFRKRTVAKTSCLIWYEHVFPKLIWKNPQLDLCWYPFGVKNIILGRKKTYFDKIFCRISSMPFFGNLQNRPMDAFHHFLMEFPSLPCCALPFSCFFKPPSLTAHYLHSVSNRHFKIWTHRQFWGLLTHQTPSRLVCPLWNNLSHRCHSLTILTDFSF